MSETTQATILVIDDAEPDLRLLKQMLAKGNYQTLLAPDGPTGLALAQARSPDLILLDVMLPLMSGYEVCEQLKADERTRAIPVIFLSALSQPLDKVRAFAAGGVDYITKPFQMDEVLARLKTHLTLHHLQKSLQEQNARLEQEIAERNRIEEELRQSEKRYRLLAESATDVIWTLDLRGRFTYVSPSVERLRGYTPEEVMQQPLEASFTPESAEIVKAGLRRAYEALIRDVPYRRKERYELEQPCKDGSTVWTEVTTSAIYDENGQFIGIQGVTRDISERRQAEVALQRYTKRLQILHEIDQAILGARSPEAIAMGAVGRIRQLIPCQRVYVIEFGTGRQIKVLAVEASVGFRVEVARWADLLYTAISDQTNIVGVSNMDTLAALSPLQQQLYAEGVRAYLIAPLVTEGRVIGTLNLEADRPDVFTSDHVDIAAEIAGLLAVAIRQTQLRTSLQQELIERKAAEEALRQSEAALRQYAEQLETQNAELDAFAHTVAHDLKNPLSSIGGYASLLTSYYDTLSPQQLYQSLQSILRGVQGMNEIIESLLLLAGVRKQTVQFHRLNMGTIVTEAQHRLEHLIKEYQAVITAPDNWPAASGYAPWVEAIWVNYISNALKYGGRPPHVELGFAPFSPDSPQPAAQKIQFWVRDNGAGLTAEQQARLFTPFTRLHTDRAEGHGLGLTIVQRIAEKLGGQVGVESKVGEGSLFWFTLPAGSSSDFAG